ncbi:phosphopantetheine-binding protein, partial [Micromonospora sp. NBRC 101691]|uniref:phosphopantetheine-binding protein n=1 Tax=Micromonospora sp. NBRC 101691 TaxID=3032198 RepID=UPI00255622A1
RLVAYLVPTDNSTIDIGDLRHDLGVKLPDYMVPSAYVTMTALPITANGKLDRNALPEPTDDPTRSPRQDVLCELFAAVLGLPDVGADDDFFDLGGHARLAGRLAARVRAILGVDMDAQLLVDHPTVAALDARLPAHP